MESVFPNGSGHFQQDYASRHTAKNVQGWFEELVKELASKLPRSHNLKNLKDEQLKSWSHIQQHTIKALVKSMTQLIRGVLVP